MVTLLMYEIFAAGKGIIHSEMPSLESGTKGIQRWVNLPPKLKTLAADYQQVDSVEVIVVEIPRVLAGDPAMALNPQTA